MRSSRPTRGAQQGSQQTGSQQAGAAQVGSQATGALQVGSQVGAQQVGSQQTGAQHRMLLRRARRRSSRPGRQQGSQQGSQQTAGAPQLGSAPQHCALASVAMAANARPTTINIGKKTRLFMGGLLVPKRWKIEHQLLTLPDRRPTARLRFAAGSYHVKPGKRKCKRFRLLHGFLSEFEVAVFSCIAPLREFVPLVLFEFPAWSAWSACSDYSGKSVRSDAPRNPLRSKEKGRPSRNPDSWPDSCHPDDPASR
jgi:hypothetical protein